MPRSGTTGCATTASPSSSTPIPKHRIYPTTSCRSATSTAGGWGGWRNTSSDGRPRLVARIGDLRCSRSSDVEQEVQHVAVLDDVLLAFLAQPARRCGTGLALVLDEVVVADRLGADEAALEVGVDHPGGLR